jgi:nucleotide-binding universal stress UspA family protein
MIQRLLVPLDGSPLADHALEYAVELAKRMGVPIILLTVVPPIPSPAFAVGPRNSYNEEQQLQRVFLQDSQHVLEKAAGRLEQDDLKPLKSLMIEPERERVGDVIARIAKQEEADLIVMGTHGRTGLDRLLLGSVAERVAHQASVPVMLVREARVKEKAVGRVKGTAIPASD